MNGHEVKRNQYPWMASIRYTSSILGSLQERECGGSLITDRHVLTSAQCLSGVPDAVGDVRVVLGAHTVDDLTSYPSLSIESFKPHEKFSYSDKKAGDDIAIITLKTPVQFNETLNPICLPDFSQQDKLFLTGWGEQNSGNNIVRAKALFEAALSELDNQTCTSQWGNMRFQREKQLCAGDHRVSCLGDNGGPLATRRDGYIYQVGVATLNPSDCNNSGALEKSSVFERVSAHLVWIKENAIGGQYCAAPHHPFRKPDPGDEGSPWIDNAFQNRWQ